MILLDLFWGFLKVGCFAFGGAYGAIPLIRDVVLSYGWLSDEALSRMIAVSESTPGPIMVNMATYVGASQAGLAGSLLATIAVVLPSFLIILLITSCAGKALKNRWIQLALRGMKPCVIGIVLSTGIFLLVQSVAPSFAPDLRALALLLCLLAGRLLYQHLRRSRLSPIGLIILSAVLGVLFYGW